MSRPSRIAERRLEALEGAAAQLAQARAGCDILSIRLRQIWRRVPQLFPELDWAAEELLRVVDACDGARSNVHEALRIDQQERTQQNRGKHA